MKIKPKIVQAAIAALLLAVSGCATSPHSTRAWEYRWITPIRTDFQKEMDVAGKDGWEIVSATPDVGGDRMSAVLRRPKR
jgi:hypothetical protein